MHAAAAAGQFPWIAALYAPNPNAQGNQPRFLSVCGGTLIRENAVLTAGKRAGWTGQDCAAGADRLRWRH